MRTLLLFFVLAIAASVPANGQAIRFDSASYTTSASCVSGRQCPVLALPGTQVNFCQGTPGSLAGCLSSPATTYTNASALTSCSTTSQLTPATGGSCLATTDAQGNYGAWLLPGSYGYYLRVPVTAGGGTYGPYPFTVHGDSGGYTLDSLYTNLSAAVTAAGSGTLAITKAWNATPTQSLATANLLFLGNGKIQPSSSAAVTLGKFTAVSNQQIFDVSLSGATGIVFSQTPAQTYPEWFGADPTGVAESLLAIQSAVTASAAVKGCTWFTGPQYKVTGSITSPALGQLCTRGNYNAVTYFGVISGTPPRAASLIQQQNNAKTISLTGISNVVDGLDFTIPTGVTGVTAIYGTDTGTQSFTTNKITNNTIHGYSSGASGGTLLAKGIDIESSGNGNANNNVITGNIVQLATYGYYLAGDSGSHVVNANIFHNSAFACTHAAYLQNSGEMDFWISMEGNGDAITGVGVVATGFYTTTGEQGPPHLMLSGGSHDNTLYNAQRCRNSGQICMTVSADSTLNALVDMSGLFQGISTTGQRYWNFGGVGESSSQTLNLAVVQSTSDTSGSTRSAWRIAHSVNFNTVSDLSITPQGCDSQGYCGYYHATETSYDPTKPVGTYAQFGTQTGNSQYAFNQLKVGSNYLGDWFCQFVNTSARFDTQCGFQLNIRNTAATKIIPFMVRGDGVVLYPATAESAAFLEPCTIALVGMQKPNYPYATSKTRGAAPSSGGAFNVSIRCASDDGVTAAWVIQ